MLNSTIEKRIKRCWCKKLRRRTFHSLNIGSKKTKSTLLVGREPAVYPLTKAISLICFH